MSPKEQNTQQSPFFACILLPQLLHAKKNWHASVGIFNFSLWAQYGQMIVEYGMYFVACIFSMIEVLY